MTTLESNAGPAWAAQLQGVSGAAGRADREAPAPLPRPAASLVPVLSFAVVVAVSLLSLYVQVLNEQMQRAELFHQTFLTTAGTLSAAAPAREPTSSRPRTLQTASR